MVLLGPTSPGLGALGVCFGRGVVMDSPSARPKGTFNWGSAGQCPGFVEQYALEATREDAGAVAVIEVSNGFSARSPALPGSFPAASRRPWPRPQSPR